MKTGIENHPVKGTMRKTGGVKYARRDIVKRELRALEGRVRRNSLKRKRWRKRFAEDEYLWKDIFEDV